LEHARERPGRKRNPAHRPRDGAPHFELTSDLSEMLVQDRDRPAWRGPVEQGPSKNVVIKILGRKEVLNCAPNSGLVSIAEGGSQCTRGLWK
jgi:hypothetical protein